MKKRIVLELLILSMVFVIGARATYQWLTEPLHKAVPLTQELEALRVNTVMEDIMPFKQTLSYSYDFSKMIRLINASRGIKKQVYPTFDVCHIKDNITVESTTALLEELQRERKKLNDYVWDLKGYSTASIPIKKYRSFLFYLRVLGNNIAEVKQIVIRLREERRREQKTKNMVAGS